MRRDNETNNSNKQKVINGDNKQHAPFFCHLEGDTNGYYREYYRNGCLEAISPIIFVTIFSVFSCSASVLVAVNYHVQYMSLKHAFFTQSVDMVLYAIKY